MKAAFRVFLVMAAVVVSTAAQDSMTALKTAEFVSPIYERLAFGQSSLRQYCFSFRTGRPSDGSDSDICYGGLRAGQSWDWFQIMGDGSRNNLKNLGRKNWDDDFKVGVVKPYPKLKPGETRSIVVNTSGGGSYPKLGPVPMAKDDRLANRDFDDLEAISRAAEDKMLVSSYKAHHEVRRGRMYVMRVVDDKNDFYVLFRVDELERGTRCKISWKRIEAPQED